MEFTTVHDATRWMEAKQVSRCAGWVMERPGVKLLAKARSFRPNTTGAEPIPQLVAQPTNNHRFSLYIFFSQRLSLFSGWGIKKKGL